MARVVRQIKIARDELGDVLPASCRQTRPSVAELLRRVDETSTARCFDTYHFLNSSFGSGYALPDAEAKRGKSACGG